MDHAQETGSAARRSAAEIDREILATWQALRTNPSLDARLAMQVIDRLLDERPRPAQAQPSGPRAVVPRGPDPGSAIQQAILAITLRALLGSEPA